MDYVEKYKERDEKSLIALESRLSQAFSNDELPSSFSFPVTVQYELMTECNLKCLHCYNRSGDNDLSTKMKFEHWIELSHHLVEKGGISQCILSGGEPLLMGKRRLPEIMDILHNDGTGFVLITNGWLLDEEWIEILGKYRYYWIQVSIDGADAAYHDHFRGAEGSWRRAVEGALKISNAGLPLVIAHTVTPQNIDSLDKMASLAHQLGASSLILGEMLPSGRANENMHFMLNRSQRNHLYEKIDLIANKYKGRLEIQRTSGVSYQLNRYRITPNMGCIVRPNGDVRMDCMAPFVIGNIFEKNFDKIWEEKGRSCWSDAKVAEYISSIDPYTNESSMFLNHVEPDRVI